jgi:hypothetical protein
MTSKRLRIEALIASPPTPKCEEILAMLEEVSSIHPDEVRVDVYMAGEQPGVTPTKGYECSDKYRTIPCVYVNGMALTFGGVPQRASLDLMLAEELAKGPEGWEA